jgi:solute carrier family 35 protein F5
MVVYLPIAALREWIYSLLIANSYKKLCNGWNVVDPSTGLDTPLIINEMHHRPENGNVIVTDKDLSEREEGWPLVAMSEEDEPHLLAQSRELNSWDIAKCSLYLTPIWFATEVTYSFFLFLFFVLSPVLCK